VTVTRCQKCCFLVLPGKACGQCKITRSARSKKNRQQGETTQLIAGRELGRCGITELEEVHTPFRVVRALRKGRRVIVDAFPLKKVSGDWRGVAPGGRSLLCEVKSRTGEGRDDVLRWSDLQPHQREAMTRHAAAGGLSLLAWVRPEPVATCYLLPWDSLVALGFRAGQSIGVEFAEVHALRPGHLHFACLPPAATPPTVHKVVAAAIVSTPSRH
jgi:hypothetical protein